MTGRRQSWRRRTALTVVKASSPRSRVPSRRWGGSPPAPCWEDRSLSGSAGEPGGGGRPEAGRPAEVVGPAVAGGQDVAVVNTGRGQVDPPMAEVGGGRGRERRGLYGFSPTTEPLSLGGAGLAMEPFRPESAPSPRGLCVGLWARVEWRGKLLCPPQLGHAVVFRVRVGSQRDGREPSCSP